MSIRFDLTEEELKNLEKEMNTEKAIEILKKSFSIGYLADGKCRTNKDIALKFLIEKAKEKEN